MTTLSSAETGPRPMRLGRIGRSEEFGAQQVMVKAAAMVAVPIFVAVCALAGGEVGAWGYVLAVTASLPLLTWHDTVYPLLLWGCLAFVWVLDVPGAFSWWVVPAALVAFVGHCSASMSGGRPAAVPWPRASLRRDLRRAGVVVAVTVGVAVAAAVTASLQVPGSAPLLVVALLVLTGWSWLAWRALAPFGR